MAKDICIFKRVEKKYMLSPAQKAQLLDAVGQHFLPDCHGKSTICSLYLDTPDYLLIRNSIDAVSYKEKLRLRSYGTPTPETPVFLEIKKKFQGVVYKRRVRMPLKDAYIYLGSGETPIQSQIMNEIDYAMHFYRHPAPSMLIAYEREAYQAKDYANLRLTFDTGVRYRAHDLTLESGAMGKPILPEDRLLLEVKTDGAMPLWLSRALNNSGITPVSFSKYAMAYRDSLKQAPTTQQEGDSINVCNF